MSSQAGRSKARKPGKRIRPPSSRTSSSLAGPETAPANREAEVTNASTSTREQGGRGRGWNTAHGGGRRGNTGRGRGRGTPIQQGQAFFDPSGGVPRGRTKANARAKQEGVEEVVGIMIDGSEVPITDAPVPTGEVPSSSIPATDMKSESLGGPQRSSVKEEIPENVTSSGGQAPDKGYDGDDLYDTDDSDDNRKPRGGDTEMAPAYREPIIIYNQKDTSAIKTENDDIATPAVTLLNHEWFLVQLPTRLPVMGNKTGSSDTTSVPQLSDRVSTAPYDLSTFDNSLQRPGKLGKLRVHRSGKISMVFEGSSPSDPSVGPGVSMEVSEGLSCQFQQQVVVMKDGKYVPIGTIGKTMVVKPNI